MTGNGRRDLPNSEWCFVCGEDNPAGLQTRFYVEDGLVCVRLQPREHHSGYPNVTHGGVLAAIIDECMGWAAARAIGRMCVTAELTIRYRRPVPADRASIAQAEATDVSRRFAEAKGRIVDAETGRVHVEATGRFAPLTVEQTLAVDDALLYRGGEERVFDTLRAEHEARQQQQQ
jgi:uncharacterized protein (TIGR00369 family)